MDADSSYTNQDPDLKTGAEDTRQKYTRGLRELAAFLDANPCVTLPDHYLTSFVYGDDDTKEGAAKVMRAMGTCKKRPTDNGLFYLIKDFGSMELRVIYTRDEVCVKKVVGKKHVEAQLIPARLIEAHDEEIVEWDCAPILAPVKTAEERDTDREPVMTDPVNAMLQAQGKLNTNGM